MAPGVHVNLPGACCESSANVTKRPLIALTMATAMAFTTLTSVSPLPALAQPAGATSPVVINEVESNGDEVSDWFELVNTGKVAVDISGWSFVDDDPDHAPQVIPANTILQPGDYLSFYTDVDPDNGFGLGGNDSITLFDADGNQVDFTEWSGHAATTWGRIPDMTGQFAVTGQPTRNAPNTAATAEGAHPIILNEIESNGDPVGDWIELYNTDTVNSYDISGWSFVDDDPTHAPYYIPAGTIVESGGYISFYTEDTGGFGLGGNDSVILFDADGRIVDSFGWNGHAETTWGRFTGQDPEWAVTGESTRNGINVPAGERDEIATTQLPFHTIPVTDLKLGEAFVVEDMSGADFDTNGRAWVVNNDAGDIYALDHDVDTDTYTPAGHWQVTYPEGTGTPDGEGIAVTADGSIYLATERNNDNKTASRPSVLRFDAPTGTSGLLTATDEWNLSEFTGVIGANSGLETIVHLEGSTFAVGVEGTGEVIVVDLGAEAPAHIQTFQSEFQGVMAMDYNATTRQLHVLCDEVCEGASQFLTWNGTELVSTDDNIYARPANLGNFANEGYASYTADGECIDGVRNTYVSHLWADDSVSEGISLRSAQETVDTVECDTDGAPVDEDRAPSGSATGSSTGSASGFAAGSALGTLTTGALGIMGIFGVLGGILEQILAAFPTLKAYVRL